MGPFSFFLLVIATFTLSSAALLLGGMLMERRPNRSASAAPGANTRARPQDLGAHTHRPCAVTAGRRAGAFGGVRAQLRNSPTIAIKPSSQTAADP